MSDLVAEPVAPFARFSSSRVRRRRAHFVQRVVAAACLGATAVAWGLILSKANALAAIIPILVVATAPALFAKKPWLSLLPRAVLWATAAWGTLGALFGHSDHAMHGKVVFLAVASIAGLVALGRFARSIGKLRPLLAALIALSLADIVVGVLMSALIGCDALMHRSHFERMAFLVFASIALANGVGLALILKQKSYAAHLVGNAALAIGNAFDPAAMHPANWLFVALACAQVALAVAQRLPRASPRARRVAEHVVRVALIATGLAVFLSSS